MISFDDGDGIHIQASAEGAREHSQQRIDRFPASYKHATWRCVIPGQHTPGDIGIGFNLGDEVIRVRLDRENAELLYGALQDALSAGPLAVESPFKRTP